MNTHPKGSGPENGSHRSDARMLKRGEFCCVVALLKAGATRPHLAVPVTGHPPGTLASMEERGLIGKVSRQGRRNWLRNRWWLTEKGRDHAMVAARECGPAVAERIARLTDWGDGK